MKYNLKLIVEELESLMKGKTIDLLDDEENDVKVTLKGLDWKKELKLRERS